MAIPPDDPTIPDDAVLFRRVFPDPDSLQAAEGGGLRPYSATWRSATPLSVDMSTECTPEATRDRDVSRPFHVAGISVGHVRGMGCRVVRDPLPDNPAHCLIYGVSDRDDGSIPAGLARKLSKQARVILINPAAPLPDGGV